MMIEAISALRNLLVKMKEKLEDGNRRKDNLDKENNDLKRELDACKKVVNNTCTECKRETSTDSDRLPPRTTSGQVLPSFGGKCANNNTSLYNKRETSIDRERVPPKPASRQLSPPNCTLTC